MTTRVALVCVALGGALATGCGADTDLLTTAPGKGTGSGGGSGTGSGSGSGSACSELEQCCASVLPPEAQSGCAEIVAAGECAQALSELQQAGLCSAGSGSGSSGGQGECATLEACCETLDAADQDGCDRLVALGDATACGQALSDLASIGSCVR